MKDIHSQVLVPLSPVRATICGMGLRVPCDLLLDEKPCRAATTPRMLEWTILRAPDDLPDGDYTVTTRGGRIFHATRIDGSWMQHTDGPISSVEPGAARHIAERIAQADRHAIGIMLFAALITYVLPTVIELIAAHDPGFGVGVIVFGDLTGCACLAALLGMPMFGVLLYVLLSLFEGCLYFTGVLSATTMAWCVDILPTLIVAGRIARLHSVRFAQR